MTKIFKNGQDITSKISPILIHEGQLYIAIDDLAKIFGNFSLNKQNNTLEFNLKPDPNLIALDLSREPSGTVKGKASMRLGNTTTSIDQDGTIEAGIKWGF